MREEFGVENKILWLPDVFGYSGAPPQILKKSGVTQFFTTKIAWNETNKMPNDTFIWKGIDGSRMFASFIPNYVRQLDAANVTEVWNRYKNKSHSDTTVMTFGFGDGGGGPTYEMLENYERLKYGIPGMPADMEIKVSERVMENDVIRVEFNNKYHIVSVFDKEEQREVLAENAEANVLEIFEDYPREYDAWKITSYYKQKMCRIFF